MDDDREEGLREEIREQLHHPVMLTREQVLDELHEMGYQVTEWQLRSWVSYGILPRPIRRVPEGATDGVARALYPAWMVDVIVSVLHEMAHGASREQLKELIPSLLDIAQSTYELERASPYAGDYDELWAIQKLLDEEKDGMTIPALTTRRPGPPPPRITRALQRAVADYAMRVASAAGHPVAKISLQLETENGETITISLPAPTHGSE